MADFFNRIGRFLSVAKGRKRPKANIMRIANPEQFTDVEIKSGHGLSRVQTGYSRAPYAGKRAAAIMSLSSVGTA
jgi:hypothetical protein